MHVCTCHAHPGCTWNSPGFWVYYSFSDYCKTVLYNLSNHVVLCLFVKLRCTSVVLVVRSPDSALFVALPCAGCAAVCTALSELSSFRRRLLCALLRSRFLCRALCVALPSRPALFQMALSVCLFLALISALLPFRYSGSAACRAAVKSLDISLT